MPTYEWLPYSKKVVEEMLEKELKTTCFIVLNMDEVLGVPQKSRSVEVHNLSRKVHKKRTTRLGPQHAITEMIENFEAAATDVKLAVEEMNHFKMKHKVGIEEN